ncbi:alpha/beta hydrolase [Pontibacter sp. BT310]|uniref:Alpha/beta hydrolase n=1 Tax=Pontibacter populi TaxID=890055 RepID=A0ABS6XFK5_9BACT|nr:MULTISPECIES: alpha/beta hydrolase [Pontibacter]MBJ6119909.1 alpha/beta hydrolase [Pontibacter sp. BT310]MBR0572338.1 alpha/beta hydrolase [Microvirga sp. STS03]MBW3366762.1 alpha/beta hydrolase [Pontibacter populi]
MNIKRILPLLFFFGSLTLATAQQTKLVNVGGHSLEMIQAGSGDYTVIFESGFGTDYKVWGNVASEVMNTSQVMLYSRAGTGKSEPNPNPQTLEQAVHSLTTLIEKANLKAPFILVGHSYGAFVIRGYAALNPEKVKGLVFVDPAHEKMMQELKKADPAKAMKDVELQNSFMPAKFKQENELINGIFERAVLPDFGVLPQVPAVVLTSVQERANPELFLHEPQGVAIWRKLHSEFFSQFTSGAHIVTANSGHNIHREEPQLVVSAINQVIQAATKQKVREDHEAKMAQLGNKLTEATTYLSKRKDKQAEALVFEALKSSGFGERTINTIAYQQLSKPESMAVAVLIFKYNTVQFAESANAFDSYGEALMQQGKLKLAEQQFNKAIELATISQDTSTLKNSKNNLEKISQLKKTK